MAWNVTVTPRKRKGTSRMKWENNLEEKKNQQKKQLATGKARGQRRVYIEFPRDCDHTNHFSGQVSYVCNGAKNVVGNKPPVHFRKGLNPVFIKLSFLSQVAELSQRIDPRIVEKIHALAGDSVRDVNEMWRHIHVYVQNSLFLRSVPSLKSNKRFCPSQTTLH